MSYIKGRKLASAGLSLASGVSVGAALLSGAVPTTVLAQSAAQINQQPGSGGATSTANKVTTLPEIKVIGVKHGYFKEYVGSQKFTTPVSSTPKTIQIIDKNLMTDQQSTTLTEALRNTPGVGAFAMGETGSSSTGDAVYIRGIDAAGSIFVDGIRDAGSVSRDTFNIEQVEVVKGADGSMFGRTSLNGTINMVTKQAHLGNHYEANIGFGTHRQKRSTLDLNHQIGDSTAFRLNVVGEDSGVPGRDIVNNKLWGIAPALALGLGTDTRLNIDYLHLYQHNQPDGGVPMIGMPGYHDHPKAPGFGNAPRASSSDYYGTYSDYDVVRKDQFTVAFEKDISDKTLFHATARWARTHQKYKLSSVNWSEADILGNGANPGWQMGDYSNWLIGRVVNTKDQENRILAVQTGLVQELTTGPLDHTLSYGIEYSQERVNSINYDISPSASNFPVNVYHPSHSASYNAIRNGTGAYGKTTTVAGYLFDTVEIGDKWQLNGGIRLDHYRADYDSGAASDLNTAVSKTLTSWQLGALYKINSYGNVYAQYAIAYQPPGNDGLVYENKAKYADRPEYEPQKAKTIEIGTKWKLADDNLLLSAAVFRTDISNQVEQDQITKEYNQTGKKRVDGFELGLAGKITPNWDISMGYAHTKAKIIDGATVAMDGSSSLNYTPKDAFTSWTTYNFGHGFSLGAGARYIGSMSRDDKGETDTPEKIDGYWVVDAMVKYEINKNVGLQLNGYNLTNKDYVAAINKKGHRYIPGAGRSAMLNLNLKY